MTREQATKHATRLLTLVQAVGSVSVMVFFMMGFGLVTPAKTLAQLKGADSLLAKSVAALHDTVTANNQARMADRAEDRAAIHAVLVATCMTAKPPVLDRIHIACTKVLAEGEIQ